METSLGRTASDLFFTTTAGTKDLLEQQTAKKYPVALSDSRIAGNFSSPKLPAMLSTGTTFISWLNLHVCLGMLSFFWKYLGACLG